MAIQPNPRADELRMPKYHHILIIDRCQVDVDRYCHFLKQDPEFHYQVSHCPGAKRGLALFLQTSPDVVLVSDDLEDMAWGDLVSAIQRQNTTAVPVVMLMGSEAKAIVPDSLDQGVKTVLKKETLNKTILLQTLHQLLAPPTSSIRRPHRSTIDVLIIDDSPVFLQICQNIFEVQGEVSFNSYFFEEAEAGMNFLQQRLVDVILLDYQLSEHNAFELLDRLQGIPSVRNIPIVLVTGYGDESLVVEGFKRGIADYLPKREITPPRLRRTICEAVEKNRMAQQLQKMNFHRQFLGEFITQIRQSLHLETVLYQGTDSILRYLNCDRVLIYQLQSQGPGKVIEESRNPEASILPLKTLSITDSFLENPENHREYSHHCRRQIVDNVDDAPMSECHRELLQHYQVKSVLTLPLLRYGNQSVWGLLIVHFCQDYHYWETLEVDFLLELAQQLALGIDQCLLVADLQAERDRANESARLKSAFLANMSHEIRTPMNGILGMSELLSLQNLTLEQQDYVSSIHSCGKDLLALLNDILDFSKLESERFSLEINAFYLGELVSDCVQLFKSQAQERGLELSLTVDPRLDPIYHGDGKRIRQIVVNLLDNALKFTPRGKVTLSVHLGQPREDHRENVDFAIADTGIGIAQESMGQLFQLFSRIETEANQAIKGTGLGLAICKQLVKLMGGAIGVDSVLGEGSRFWFTLPLEVAQDSDLLAEETSDRFPVPQGNSGDRTILVVEDNLQNQRLIKKQLQLLGYGCDIVGNGQVALDRLGHHPYDLVLMDCQMPVLDGYETTKRMRQDPQTKNQVVVALTAFAMKGDREKCLAAGMNDFLSKPFSLSELQVILSRWLPLEKQSDQLQSPFNGR